MGASWCWQCSKSTINYSGPDDPGFLNNPRLNYLSGDWKHREITRLAIPGLLDVMGLSRGDLCIDGNLTGVFRAENDGLRIGGVGGVTDGGSFGPEGLVVNRWGRRVVALSVCKVGTIHVQIFYWLYSNL